MLIALFLSSCHWGPFAIDSPLTVPWSPEITTFSAALNATLPDFVTERPAVMRVADRCWCDFAGGSVFEPYNITKWERRSVQRFADELVQKHHAEMAASATTTNATAEDAFAVTSSSTESAAKIVETPRTTTAATSAEPTASRARALFYSLLNSAKRKSAQEAEVLIPEYIPPVEEPTPAPTTKLPFFRREYDLRPSGINLVIDFGWSKDT